MLGAVGIGEKLEQRSEDEDLVRRVDIDVALTDRHPGVLTKDCEQLDVGAVWSLGSSYRLAHVRHLDQVRSGMRVAFILAVSDGGVAEVRSAVSVGAALVPIVGALAILRAKC